MRGKTTWIGLLLIVAILAAGYYVFDNWYDLTKPDSCTVLNESYPVEGISSFVSMDGTDKLTVCAYDIIDYTLRCRATNDSSDMTYLYHTYKIWKVESDETSLGTNRRVKEVGSGFVDKDLDYQKAMGNSEYEFEIDLQQFDANIVEGEYIIGINENRYFYFNITYTGESEGAIEEFND